MRSLQYMRVIGERPARSMLLGLLLLIAASSGCGIPGTLLAASAVEQTLCSPYNQLDTETRFDATSPDAIVVLGVSRIKAMTVVLGVDDGVVWRRDRSGMAAGTLAEHGFVVFRLRPQTGKKRYAIARVALEPGATDCYILSTASSTLAAFDAPPGRVTYLGGVTIEFVRDGGGSRALLREDAGISKQQAMAFVAARYPGIRAEMTGGRLAWVYTE